MSDLTPMETATYFAESALDLLVQRPQSQRTYMTSLVVTRRDAPVFDFGRAYPAHRAIRDTFCIYLVAGIGHHGRRRRWLLIITVADLLRWPTTFALTSSSTASRVLRTSRGCLSLRRHGRGVMDEVAQGQKLG